MQAAKLLAASGTATKLYAEDVFSAWVRTGTGSSATVTTNIDMTQGYMLWTKGRSGATDHALYHSARGVTKDLVHNTTAAETTQATGLTAVSATGHTIGALAKMNTTSATYVDWVLRNADKFYNHTTVVKTGGSNATVSFANLTTLGMVRVKRTDSTGSWYIWHRSLTAGKLLIGETTAAEATLGHITVSGTTVTLVNGTIADGTYLVEGFAHDTGTDGLIQCGSFTTDGSGNATVSLGWEPQFVLSKANDVANWIIADAARGMPVNSASSLRLNPNSSGVENTGNSQMPTATGFTAIGLASTVHFYLAIRRPNKPPTTGTQVYSGITSSAATGTAQSTGFPVDTQILTPRGGGTGSVWHDRLRGVSTTATASSVPFMNSSATTAEANSAANTHLWNNDGFAIAANWSGVSTMYHNFKRAPGCFDIVCYTGTGSATTVSHGLGAVPELMIVKERSAARLWPVYVASLGNTSQLFLEQTASVSTGTGQWNSTSPTASVFSVGSGTGSNELAGTYVTYLFATLPGISKVGSYTGNGSSLTLDMGFTTGARFFMVKRTDSTGDWYVFDVTRGIIAGSDPHLSLNTTTAEVTTDDSVDPTSVGLIVNQLAATNINVTSATYIFLALA